MERVQYNTGLLKQQYNKRPTFGVHLRVFDLTKKLFDQVIINSQSSPFYY